MGHLSRETGVTLKSFKAYNKKVMPCIPSAYNVRNVYSTSITYTYVGILDSVLFIRFLLVRKGLMFTRKGVYT